MTARERLLGELRPVSFAIAYRMLGSVSEAEDVVQEALLRVHRALEAGERIASPRAFVATVTTRLAIERYVGEWLPEPIVTDGRDDPARHAETADSLSLAMLVVLESLSPEQRAALLLRDVFWSPRFAVPSRAPTGWGCSLAVWPGWQATSRRCRCGSMAGRRYGSTSTANWTRWRAW